MISKIAFIMLSLYSGHLLASMEGIPTKALQDYAIAGFSRPCCNFDPSPFQRLTGLAGAMNSSALGQHHFARLNKQSDTVGMVYTCRAGFVDISHLRDNADWAAHIYSNLPKWLGKGQEVLARLEGGFQKRSVYFHAIEQKDIDSLTQKDREKLAIAIGFDMALMHEIPTSFKLAVSAPSTPFIWERASAFSVEDAYSNLLGNYLGVKSAQSALPFNQAMTKNLQEALDERGLQSQANALKAYDLVEGKWWIKSVFGGFRKVLKRNFNFQVQVNPLLIPNAPFCPDAKMLPLEVPLQLSNGKSVNDYFEVRGLINDRFIKQLKSWNIDFGDTLTQQIYPEIIENIRQEYIKIFGPDLNEP